MRSCSRNDVTASRIAAKQRFSPSFGAYATSGLPALPSQKKNGPQSDEKNREQSQKKPSGTEQTPPRNHRTSFGSTLFFVFVCFFAARFTRLAASRANSQCKPTPGYNTGYNKTSVCLRKE